MDFLMEFIFEVVLEGIFELTVKNPKVKLWVRTAVFLLIAEAVPVVLGIAAVSMYRNGNTSGGIVGIIICTALAIGFLIGGIYGHKRNWKQD